MENNNSENKYICQYCERHFKRKSDLSLHINCTHLKITKRRVAKKECPYCLKFIITGKYDIHIKNCKLDYTDYYCEKCGKLVTKKFGSGRFCSQKCSNSRVLSEQAKQKLAIKAKNNPKGWNSFIAKLNKKQDFEKRKQDYYNNPNKCTICGKILDYKRKNAKTCNSKECLHIINSRNGGYKKHSRKGNAGYYKGIYCDSTYELIFLIYCLDHNISIIRNKEYFIYEYNGKKYRYYPDFLINNRMLIEIKNFNSDIVKLKLNSVDRPIKILYGKDLFKIAQYVADKYNINFNKHLDKINGNFKCLYENK